MKHTLDHMGFDDEIVALRADLETVAEKIKLCQEMIQVGLSLEDGLGEVLGFLESCQTRIPALVKAGGEGLLSEDVFARVLQVNDALTATLEFEKNGTSLDKVASKATNNITNNSSSNVNIGSSNKSQANVGKSYAASQDLLHFDNNGSGLLPPPRSASGSGPVQKIWASLALLEAREPCSKDFQNHSCLLKFLQQILQLLQSLVLVRVSLRTQAPNLLILIEIASAVAAVLLHLPRPTYWRLTWMAQILSVHFIKTPPMSIIPSNLRLLLQLQHHNLQLSMKISMRSWKGFRLVAFLSSEDVIG